MSVEVLDDLFAKDESVCLRVVAVGERFRNKQHLITKPDGVSSELSVVVTVVGHEELAVHRGSLVTISRFRKVPTPKGLVVRLENEAYKNFYHLTILVREDSHMEIKDKATESKEKQTEVLQEPHSENLPPAERFEEVCGVVVCSASNGVDVVLLRKMDSSEVKILLPTRKSATSQLKLKTGDVVKAKGIMESESVLLCSHLENLMVFSAFKEQVKLRRYSGRPALKRGDLKKFYEVEQWFAKDILKTRLSELPRRGYVNIACQIIERSAVNRDTTYLCIWDGTVPKQDILHNCLPPLMNKERNEDLFRAATGKCAYIALYDQHCEKARKLQLGSFIVIFNAKIFNQTLSVFGGKEYGRMVRVLRKESILGQLLQRQLDGQSDPEIPLSMPPLVENQRRSSCDDRSLRQVEATCTSAQPPKYQYQTLRELRQSNKKYCNVYGIVVQRLSGNPPLVFLKDESTPEVRVLLRGEASSVYYPRHKPGDVVRFHRLMVSDVTYSCFHPRNMLIFSAFKSTIKIKEFSKSHTFDEFDQNRHAALEKWFAEELSQVSFSDTPDSGYFNFACQIVGLIEMGKDVVSLCVWDGTIPNQNNLTAEPSDRFDGVYNSQVRAASRHRVSYVKLYDHHAVKARKLLPGCYIAVFNAKVVKFGVNVYGGDHYGRIVRKIDEESVLGKLLKKKIETANSMEIQATLPMEVRLYDDLIERDLPGDSVDLLKTSVTLNDGKDKFSLVAKVTEIYRIPKKPSDIVYVVCAACKSRVVLSSFAELQNLPFDDVGNLLENLSCVRCSSANVSLEILIVFALTTWHQTTFFAILKSNHAVRFLETNPVRLLFSNDAFKNVVDKLQRLLSSVAADDARKSWKLRDEGSLFYIEGFSEVSSSSSIATENKSTACNLSHL